MSLVRRLRGTLLALAALLGGSSTLASAAEPIRILAAGSLGTVLPKLVAASGVPADAVAAPTFGPAGVLRDRLLAGETADLFASADTAGPAAVAAKNGQALVLPFARNRMCLLTPERLGVTAPTLLDRMLTPGFRLAVSTPGADPGGDYARAVFRRAEPVHPGAEAALTAKAEMLLGGPGSMMPQPGKSPAATIFLADRADGLLYYCSGTASAAREVPGLVSIPVPDALEVGPVYGLALLSDRPEAARLALFMLSEAGQKIIVDGGLLPLIDARAH